MGGPIVEVPWPGEMPLLPLEFKQVPADYLSFHCTLREIDCVTWTLGDKVLIKRHALRPPCLVSWGDGRGGWFSMTEAPKPLPEGVAGMKWDRTFYQIDEKGSEGASWAMGHAILEVRKADHGYTHVETLQALQRRKLSFQTPEVIYHGLHGEYCYLLYTQIKGEPLSRVWPKLRSHARHVLAESVGRAQVELAQWTSTSICSAGGRPILLDDLAGFGHEEDPTRFDPDRLRHNAEEAGMDCSTLVFAHNDLKPQYIVVDPVTAKLVGIWSWELAGFVPRALPMASLITFRGLHTHPSWDTGMRLDWIWPIRKVLRENGCENNVVNYQAWLANSVAPFAVDHQDEDE